MPRPSQCDCISIILGLLLLLLPGRPCDTAADSTLIQRHTGCLFHLPEAFLVRVDTSTRPGRNNDTGTSDLGFHLSPRSSLGPLALQTYIEQAQ